MRFTLALVILSGCATQRPVKVAHAIQPNPLASLGSPDELPVAERLYIFQSPPSNVGVRYQFRRNPLLRNWAELVVVSRDRLRFHVGITRFEEENADTRGWRAWLEDDRGRRLSPVTREVARMDRYAAGRVDSRSVYVGNADYVFYERDLITPDTRGLTLVLTRDDEVYRFEWEFDGGRWVRHHGYRELDRQLKTIVLPPLGARPLASRWEGEED